MVKGNLVKHQKVSKYDGNDCLQNFIFIFLSLLAGIFFKKQSYLARIFFIFLKNVLKQSWNSFYTKFRPQSIDRKSSYEVSQILALFCNLIALILG